MLSVRGVCTEEEEDLMKSVQFVQSDESLLTRDALFARVNCCLHGAAVELCSTNKRLQRATSSQSSSDDEQLSVRFDLSNVNIAFDGSPRTQASKLKVSLETLHLHDLLHKDSLFPVLIAPQTRVSHILMCVRMCVCVCACAYVRVRMCVCVCACHSDQC